MKLTSLLALVILSAAIVFPQQGGNDTLSLLNKRFQAFEYEKAIAAADSMLLTKEGLSKDVLLEVYRIKGISHFSLLQDLQSEESFSNILKLDSSYVLDTAKTSPKILAFFNQVKNKFREELKEEERLRARQDTVFITKTIFDSEAETRVKNSVFRSLILPGWGHLYSGHTTKGTILTILGGITLLSSAYFIYDSDVKEDDYKKAKSISDISDKYDKYNNSYQLKNYSLIALAAVWLYSQIDLLFISDTIQESNENAVPEVGITGSSVNFNFKMYF
jgi:hypothetical protein